MLSISYGPISDGVTDSDGGGGKLIRVGVDILIALLDNQEMAKMNESDGKKKKFDGQIGRQIDRQIEERVDLETGE